MANECFNKAGVRVGNIPNVSSIISSNSYKPVIREAVAFGISLLATWNSATVAPETVSHLRRKQYKSHQMEV